MLARWEKTDVYVLCRETLKECLEYNPARHVVYINPNCKWKVEALYEFCAERGRLSAFELAYRQVEEWKMTGDWNNFPD